MDQKTLRTLSGFFGRCFLLAVALQVVALGLALGLHDWAYSIHSQLFQLSTEAFDICLYAFFGTMKVLGLFLFLLPWAALRMMAARAT